MKSIFIKKWLMVLLSGSLITGILVAALPGTALAAAPATKAEKAMWKSYKYSKRLRIKQTNTINKANKTITMIQNRLPNYQARGRDTASLEAALAAYQAQIAQAQSLNAEVINLLAAHSGFSSSGVTDITPARETMKTVGQDQFQINNILSSATKAWNKAYTMFLKS